MLKAFGREYFSFSRKERIGVYILLTIILSCAVITFFLPVDHGDNKYDLLEYQKAFSKFKQLKDSSSDDDNAYSYKNYRSEGYKRSVYKPFDKSRAELFLFDPNTLPGAGWRRLGIRDRTISTIEKYLSKGGHFYKAGDISKIWGLGVGDVSRLIPYVRITSPVSKVRGVFSDPRKYAPYHKAIVQPFDINFADSAMLDALPGIGGHLAKRILAFRDKLGGFASVEQVKETFGLPDSTFLKIKELLFIGNAVIKKFDINIASIDQMRSHPYFRYQIANSIVQYRMQHGPYSAISGLKNIMTLSDEIFKKIAPYVYVGEGNHEN